MASLSTCHLGLWLGWQILLNLNIILKGKKTKHTDGFVYVGGLVADNRHLEIGVLFIG